MEVGCSKHLASLTLARRCLREELYAPREDLCSWRMKLGTWLVLGELWGLTHQSPPPVMLGMYRSWCGGSGRDALGLAHSRSESLLWFPERSWPPHHGTHAWPQAGPGVGDTTNLALPQSFREAADMPCKHPPPLLRPHHPSQRCPPPPAPHRLEPLPWRWPPGSCRARSQRW